MSAFIFMSRQTNRQFRNKMREYLKGTINELKTNSKNENTGDLCMDVSEIKRVYWPRTNLVGDEKGDSACRLPQCCE